MSKTLADLPIEATARKLGLLARVEANNGPLYCLPLDRGLTIALVPSHLVTASIESRHLILRITHHSGRGLRGLPDLDWPATKPALASARCALAELLATGVYWSAELEEFVPTGSQHDHASRSAEIIASEQRAFAAKSRLVRTALPPKPEPVPLMACRVYARQDREGVWSSLSVGSWLRHVTHQPADASALEIADAALAYSTRHATLRDGDRMAWQREDLPRLDVGSAVRGVLSASRSWLDFGVVQTSRGPERIVLVMHDPTAWTQCVTLLEQAVERVEDARAEPHGVNYRHVWGTWSKGERAGEIRFPASVPRDKRAEHLAEQAVFDTWSRGVEAARGRVAELAEWLTCGATRSEGAWSPTGCAEEDTRRREEIERVRELCTRLQAVRLSGLCEYSVQQRLALVTERDLRALERASEQHESIRLHGFTIGERAGITPSRYAVEPGSEPVAPVTIKAITFDTDLRDRRHCRSIEDARGREWTYWPVERLARIDV